MIRVLILDDDELFVRTLGDSLRRSKELEFEVSTTTTAEAARQLVSDADQPFDVFLIDQRLGPGPNGIEIFQELRRLSPNTDAIIFTGVDDPDAGLRAYQSGAHRYLSKPFDTRELVWILRSLRRWRDTQYERDWLKVLNEVAEAAQRALSLQEVAEIVVRGGLRLGFERARLWWFSEDEQTMIGASQAGNKGLDDFAGLRMPVAETTYLKRGLEEREPIFFQGPELGEGYLSHKFSGQGYELPVGEWAQVALWVGERCWGVLTLDNASQPRPLRPEQRRLLGLLSRQVAAALERVHLYQREQRKTLELVVLNQIGQRVAARAVLGDLSTLLREVRDQVSELIDVRNFMVVLLDEETGQLDFRLHVENGRLRRRHWRPIGSGLVGHLIVENKPLFLPWGGKSYREAHAIPLYGRQSRCWLGVPLRVGERAVGTIVVQDYEQERAYSREDQRLMMAVADQVAGAIQAAYLKERQEEISRQLGVLHQASAEIMTLAEEHEDWLWHAMLTAATAGYALRFNRAILFLGEEGKSHLRGRMGIGHFDARKARRDWHKDRCKGLDFGDYLELLRSRRLQTTPIEDAVSGWALDMREDEGAFRQVLQTGQRQIVSSSEARRRLPQAFIERFGIADYAILPLQAGNKAVGLVVVDNIHDRKPIRETSLDYLEPLLTQAALILETLRQRHAQNALIDLNYTVMAELSNRSLKETLDQICQVAQAVVKADTVEIHSLKPGIEPFEFDSDNVGRAGTKLKPHDDDAQRPNYISAHILRAGTLVVPNVAENPFHYDGRQLADHPFLQAERICAFIGTPLRDMTTGESLGVLYLDYRTTQDFKEQDRHQAESFASLAAVAIRNTHAAEQMRAETAAAEEQTQARERELNVLRQVLEEALVADTDERRLIRALLNACRELLRQPDIRMGLVLREWEQPKLLSQEPREVRRQYVLRPDGTISESLEQKIDRGIIGRALQTGQTQLVPDVTKEERFYDYLGIKTRSELDVPIKLGTHVLGVLNMETPAVGAFTEEHKAIVERLAAGAALALDNVRRQEHLHTVLSATRAVTAPINLKETLEAIVEAGRKVAPDLSAMTIWHREPQDGRLKLGAQFGVRNVAAMQRNVPTEGGVVWTVMHSPKPIWAADVTAEPRLRPDRTEAVVSIAAFPLRADGETVGAMFFDYRHHHEFTREERSLFHLLAETAAASVRDAARLEETRRERERLEAALKIAEAVGTTLDLNETLHQIMATLQGLLSHATPSVLTLTYDSVERVLEFTPPSREFYHIDNPERLGLTRVSVDETSIAGFLAQQSLDTRKVAYRNVEDVDSDAHYLRLILDTRSELCLTLMSGERLLGVLVLESPQPHAFNREDVKLVIGVGQQISTAIDRAYQSAQLSFQTVLATATAWAADVAHDINREVGRIRNRADWLSGEPGLSENGRQYAREIDRSAERLAGTLKRANPRSPHKLEMIVLDEWLPEVVEDLIAKCDAEVSVQWVLGCGDLQIKTSPVALGSILRHLIRNALEATRGIGTLIVRTRRLNDQQVEVQIEDTGPGISDQVWPAIFQQPVTTKGREGGMGLLFVRSTVETMGGMVRLLPFESGKGAIFGITLPIVQPSIDKEG